MRNHRDDLHRAPQCLVDVEGPNPGADISELLAPSQRQSQLLDTEALLLLAPRNIPNWTGQPFVDIRTP